MTNRKSAVRRPQSSKREREMAKIVKLYAAGTGDSITVPTENDGYESERD